MRTPILALVLAAIASSSALACEPEDLQVKATDLSNKVQELVMQKPEMAAAIGEKFTSLQTEMISDMEGACKVYDDLLAELDTL